VIIKGKTPPIRRAEAAAALWLRRRTLRATSPCAHRKGCDPCEGRIFFKIDFFRDDYLCFSGFAVIACPCNGPPVKYYRLDVCRWGRNHAVIMIKTPIVMHESATLNAGQW